MGAQPVASSFAAKLVAAVPPHVAGELVRGAPEPPVLRNRGHESPVARDRSPKLAEHGLVRLDVLQNVEDPDRTESGGERDLERIHLDERDLRQTLACDLEALRVELDPISETCGKASRTAASTNPVPQPTSRKDDSPGQYVRSAQTISRFRARNQKLRGSSCWRSPKSPPGR